MTPAPSDATEPKACERCFHGEALFNWRVDTDEGEVIKMVCEDCDWDLTNGGNENEEPGEIIIRRAEEDYEYDPLYYPKPSWYP
jgi:hypothetical protein